jgi:hypothetical protein
MDEGTVASFLTDFNWFVPQILLPLWEKEGGAKRRKDEGE